MSDLQVSISLNSELSLEAVGMLAFLEATQHRMYLGKVVGKQKEPAFQALNELERHGIDITQFFHGFIGRHLLAEYTEWKSEAPIEIPGLSEEDRRWALALVPGLDLETEFQKMSDYYKARGIVLRDLVAAWRNWVRNCSATLSGKRPPGFEPGFIDSNRTGPSVTVMNIGRTRG